MTPRRIKKADRRATERFEVGPCNDPMELWYVYDKVEEWFRYYGSHSEARAAALAFEQTDFLKEMDDEEIRQQSPFESEVSEAIEDNEGS